MLSGFNTMQYQLGLLPVSTGQQSMGVAPQMGPPPPPIQHPGQVAFQAAQMQRAVTQQAIESAQSSRWSPPPSAPMPGMGGFGWGNTMGQFAAAQPNPVFAGAYGGGQGMPSPIMMTDPAYAGYRPQGGMGGGYGAPQHIPSVMNSFGLQLPASQFHSPAMHNLQIMQARQSQLLGILNTGMGLAANIGGSILGGAVGTFFGGPLGEMAGSYLGGMVGDAAMNFIAPVFKDAQRGQQIQNMTSPWMVTGAHLNPFTGQGMERSAAQESARRLRTLQRDPDFERTGFNTQDVLRITQLASDQGLMATAHGADDITRKVKDISKTLKTLIAITGDPDVKDAIAALGQMRQLGFQGLSGQAGAVANRAMFARMAGVSQATLNDAYAAPGALMAQGVGMVGATGYGMGMASGGMSNVAVSSGAVNDLQLARAGGRQGLGQINTMMALSATNQDLYLAASLKRGANGNLGVDMDAYRSAQRMSPSEVSQAAAANLHDPRTIMEFQTRRSEMKDMVAQNLMPGEGFQNAIWQARGLQKAIPGMDLGGAIYMSVLSNSVGSGMGREEAERVARSAQLEASNPKFWSGMDQQWQAQRRQATGRARSGRASEERSLGLDARIWQGVRDFFGGVSDLITGMANPTGVSPNALVRRLQDAEEERATQANGERITRYNEAGLITSPAESKHVLEALSKPGAYGTSGSLMSDQGSWAAGLTGMGAYSKDERIRQIAFDALPHNELVLFLSPVTTNLISNTGARAYVKDVTNFAASDIAARAMSPNSVNKTYADIRKAGLNPDLLVAGAASRFISGLDTVGSVTASGAALQSHLRESIINEMVNQGKSRDDAVTEFNANPNKYTAPVILAARNSRDPYIIDTFNKAQDANSAMGAFSQAVNVDYKKDFEEKMKSEGLGGASEGTLAEIKKAMLTSGVDAVAYASAMNKSLSRDPAMAAQGITELGQLTKGKNDITANKLRAAGTKVWQDASPGARRAMLAAGNRSGRLKGIVNWNKIGSDFNTYTNQSTLSGFGDWLQQSLGLDVKFSGHLDQDVLDLNENQMTQLRLVDPTAAAGIDKYRKTHDRKYLAAVETSKAPHSTKEITDQENTKETQIIENLRSNSKELSNQVASAGGDASSSVFGESVALFADSVATFRELIDGKIVSANQPDGGVSKAHKH